MLLATLLQANAQAEKLILKDTLFTYGGPETKGNACKGRFLGMCTPGVDILQHRYVIEVYGPDSVTEGQVRGVVKGCLDIAVATSVRECGMSWQACSAAFLSGNLGKLIEAKVRTCLDTAKTISGKDIRIKTSEETYWQ
jgi:hypothetical protein